SIAFRPAREERSRSESRYAASRSRWNRVPWRTSIQCRRKEDRWPGALLLLLTLSPGFLSQSTAELTVAQGVDAVDINVVIGKPGTRKCRLLLWQNFFSI